MTHPSFPPHAFSANCFDDLPLLDDFNRANEDPLSGSNSWDTRGIFGASVTMEISTNQLTQLDTAATAHSAYAASFGRDQAACVTVATIPADADDQVSIYLRMTNTGTGSADTAYRFNVVPAAASNQFTIETFIGGAVGSNLATVTRSFSDGDKLGARALGRYLSLWHFTSSVWTCVAWVKDETYLRGGRIGVGQRDTEAKLDDFRAGDLWLL